MKLISLLSLVFALPMPAPKPAFTLQHFMDAMLAVNLVAAPLAFAGAIKNTRKWKGDTTSSTTTTPPTLTASKPTKSSSTKATATKTAAPATP
jgi:hypothetical protein